MKRWKREIKEAFTAPPPERKEAFLAEHIRYGTSILTFIRIQGGYISKSTWLFLGVLFLAAALEIYPILGNSQTGSLWMASAFLPFWCCLAAKELSKSRRYRMEEFELSSPHSLSEVAMARLLFVGGAEAALLAGLAAMLAGSGKTGILEGGIYLLTPYLLTSFLSLVFIRRCSRENELWLCLLAAALTSSLLILGGVCYPCIYEEAYFGFWGAALCLFLGGNIREITKFNRQKEEYLWNFD